MILARSSYTGIPNTSQPGLLRAVVLACAWSAGFMGSVGPGWARAVSFLRGQAAGFKSPSPGATLFSLLVDRHTTTTGLPVPRLGL